MAARSVSSLAGGEQQRAALRLARALRQDGGRSVGLVGLGGGLGSGDGRAPGAVRGVALLAAQGLAALGAPVALVSVMVGEPGEGGDVALLSSVQGVTELMVRAPPGGQIADEIRDFRARLEESFRPLVWDLTTVDVLGLDAPVLHVVGEVMVVARAGKVNEDILGRLRSVVPPGRFRGVILVD